MVMHCSLAGDGNASKQAFLVLAHDDSITFRTLLRMLDCGHNDIYIHMDAKNANYCEKEIESTINISHIEHVQRVRVLWGGYAMVEAELNLLRAASSNGPYMFYHLISGADLPIQNQETIYNFFRENRGKEFIGFQDDITSFQERFNYHYVHFNFRKRSNILKFNRCIVLLQKILGIRKKQGSTVIYKGDQWFSVSDDFVRYVLNQEGNIRRIFKGTNIPDESFMQTLCMESPFANSLYNASRAEENDSIARLIDWERMNPVGGPHVFTFDDRHLLAESSLMFARKFSDEIDVDIIKWVEDKYGRHADTFVESS